MVAMAALAAPAAAAAAAGRASLSILDFGGKADGETNNQLAIQKAIAACDRAGGCELRFPALAPDAAQRSPPPYHPWGPPPTAVYRTSAVNLTSHLKLVLEPGVQLRGTENFADNCAARAA